MFDREGQFSPNVQSRARDTAETMLFPVVSAQKTFEGCGVVCTSEEDPKGI